LGRLLELRRLVAPLARRGHLRLDGLPRLREFGCQRLGPVVLSRQLFSCSGGISRERGDLFALLAERLCGGRGLRFQLQIEPIDGAAGLGRLLRQNLLTWLVLRRLSRLRRRQGLPDERSYADERRRDQGCGEQEKGK